MFVESYRVGMRKPEPGIYALVCRELAVAPAQAILVDDIGRNLKPARDLGMGTIKFLDVDQALRELGEILELDLL